HTKITPNLAVEPTASSFGSAALRLRFRRRLTAGVRRQRRKEKHKGEMPTMVDMAAVDTATLDARWSYFFVGGHYSGEAAAREMSAQMYVRATGSATVTQRYPIVMMHGMAQTGNNFIATPDGRPGWVHDFASRGYRVYVVDQVGRGRSGTSSKRYGPYAT